MRISFLISLILLLSNESLASYKVRPDSNMGGTKDTLILKDIPEAASIDSAILCFYEDLRLLTHDLSGPEELLNADSIPSFSDSVYQARLAELNQQTPFELSYNHIVGAFIQLYVSKRRALSSRCLGRAEQYFPLFEETFDRYNLPLELKYLAVVESALEPTARSSAGATGLWQFMYGTGKVFDLEINSYVDQRKDPVKSTEAAAKYLSYLYNMFGDWNLALAAYNCGEGRVSRAIRRSGGLKDYWEVYPFLPRETRGYVPAFIAVNYLFKYAKEHHIASISTEYRAYEMDSVHVHNKVSFQTIAEIIGIEETKLEEWNPVYRLKVVPGYDDYKALYLPKEYLNLWVANEDTIHALLTQKEEETAVEAPKDVIYYTVRSGDYLGKIASHYGCSVRQIQYWNGLTGSSLKPGQRLVLYANQVSAQQPIPQQPVKIQEDGENVYYSIRPGDTLWDIAKARGVSVEDLKRWNTGLNFNKMKPGERIVIGKAS